MLEKDGVNVTVVEKVHSKAAELAGNVPGVSVMCSDAMEYFERKIEGFNDNDTIMSAVESRTSSPVRIIRDENYQSNVRGLIPAGEGAGYAGGITSAAIDGIKIFEFIGKNFHKPEDFRA